MIEVLCPFIIAGIMVEIEWRKRELRHNSVLSLFLSFLLMKFSQQLGNDYYVDALASL